MPHRQLQSLGSGVLQALCREEIQMCEKRGRSELHLEARGEGLGVGAAGGEDDALLLLVHLQELHLQLLPDQRLQILCGLQHEKGHQTLREGRVLPSDVTRFSLTAVKGGV